MTPSDFAKHFPAFLASPEGQVLAREALARKDISDDAKLGILYFSDDRAREAITAAVAAGVAAL